jgi:UTP--glucose-1-phosphate uridylyltransferase
MIRKAVIPAAGFGTRFLPATKSQPKEMLPIVDTPTIQLVVEEAVSAGITDILMIIGKGKRAIEEHFDRNFELESHLEERGKWEELKSIRSITSMANIHFVWQKELNGLGDAIRYARFHVNNEPFAVLLGDTLLESTDGPVTSQLVNIFDQYGKSIVALEEVPAANVNRYGIISGKSVNGQLLLLDDLIEKPSPALAPSNLAVASRYIFTPEIFDYLENLTPGINNEIQLTDAMRAMVREHEIYGWKFRGKRYDIGSKIDFLKTNVTYGLNREDIGMEFKQWLKELVSAMN